MTPGVRDYIKQLRDEGNLEGRTLDVGSQDINGCVADLFRPEYYIGLDKVSGPNVSMVADVMSLDPLYWHFRNVLCLEVLEHMIDPLAVVVRIHNLLFGGGRAVITTRGFGYPLHDAPEDYYRFSVHALEAMFKFANFSEVSVIEVNDSPHGTGIYATGVK